MKCVACFFDRKYQKFLKRNASAPTRFEDRLALYAREFLSQLATLEATSDCSCQTGEPKPDLFHQWTEDFRQALVSNTDTAQETFRALQECYLTYITRSSKPALDSLWTFLEAHSLVRGAEHPLHISRLLFRGRRAGSFDPKDAKNLFHIPFPQRRLIGNQRFSASGQPMVYFGTCLLGIVQELEEDLSNLNCCGFLPNYSIHYHKRMYEVRNTLPEVLANLPAIVAAGCQVDYRSTDIGPNHATIQYDIQRSILAEVLTFPKKQPGSFVEEYALPQMLTTALIENGYDGITFPSTKDYGALAINRYNTYEMNVAFFVRHSGAHDHDLSLFDSFTPIFAQESGEVSAQSVLAQIESVSEKTRASNENNNDFIIPMVTTKIHIESMNTAQWRSIPYFETAEGQMELRFYSSLVSELGQRIL